MDVVEKLKDLYQLDVDAIAAYEEAIDKVENPQLKDRLNDFKRDHEAHLKNLAGLIEQKGGEVPEEKNDLEGYLIEGVTALRSSFGDEQALQAMKLNEEITTHRYAEAMKELASYPEIEDVIQANHEDERKHLEFIKQELSFGENLRT